MLKNVYILSYLVFVILSFSCVDPNESEFRFDSDEIALVNTGIYEEMKNIYYWYEYLPNIDPTAYDSPYELMDDLRYTTDLWSFVMEKDKFIEQFEEGHTFSHGFAIGRDTEDNVYIVFVFNNSPADIAGVKRGWRINKINGTNANYNNYSELTGSSSMEVTNNFEFITPQEDTISKSITKKTVDITPILYNEVIELDNGEKAGYFVFEEFIDTAMHYLTNVFSEYKSKNVSHLIIDLRYNGGGVNTVAEYLGNLIAGKNHNGEVFYTIKHNNKNERINNTYTFRDTTLSLNIKSLYFITTANTASASEFVINGLKPYFNSTTIIGSKTHGKPVGMYIYSFNDFNYVFAPISFNMVNVDGYGDYFDGIDVDYNVVDNVLFDFGDRDEPCLNAALQLLNTGVYTPPVSSLKSDKITTLELENRNRFKNNFFIR